MKIVWDEPKRLANIDKHDGLDFADLTFQFFLDSMVVDANDSRSKALGMLNGQMISVIFAALGTEAISVISMRPASKRERKLLP